MRHLTRTKRWLVVPVVAAIAFAGACGGGGGGDDDKGKADDKEEAAGGRDQDSPGFEDLRASDDLDVESTDENSDEDSDETDFTGDEEFGDFESIEDDSGRLTLEVPVEWSDHDGSITISDPETGEESGAGVAASPDLDDFDAFFDVPGVFFGADSLPEGVDDDDLVSALLVNNTPNSDGAVCTLDTNEETYDDGFYEGAFDVYTDCGGTGAVTIVLAAVSRDNPGFDDYYIVLKGQVVSEADADALDNVVLTSVFEA